MAQRNNIDPDQIQNPNDTTKFLRGDATWAAPSSGIAGVKIDKNGTLIGTRPEVNLIEGSNVTLTVADNSGSNRVDVTVASTGSGSSGFGPYNLTDPTSVTFTWRNQGSASVTNRTRSIFMAVPAVGGDQIRGQEISAPGSFPWSVTIGLVIQLQSQNFNSCGLYVCDGTKLETLTLISPNNMVINQWNNVSSNHANPASPGLGGYLSPIFLKVQVDNSSPKKLNWFWSPNGEDFIQVYTETVTNWLAGNPTSVGWYGNSNNGTWPIGVWLVSWVQGT